MSTQHEKLAHRAISRMLNTFNRSYNNEEIADAFFLSGSAWELLAKAVLIKENITPPNSMSSWEDKKVRTDALYRHFKDVTGLTERQMQVIYLSRDRRDVSGHSGQSPAGNPKNHHKHLAMSQSLFNEVAGKYFPEDSMLVQIDAAIQHEVDKLGQVSADIAHAILIGSWDSSNASDVAILEEMLDKKYNSCESEMRTIASTPGGLLEITDGIWSMPNRKLAWRPLGSYITKRSIDTFRKVSTKVLTERDPYLGLARVENSEKVAERHSLHIRRGLAGGLALLGSHPEALISFTSPTETSGLAREIVTRIFKDADWELWVSLSGLLPTLAEAAPDEFIAVVKDAISQKPSPFMKFIELGQTANQRYMANLLWALEGLAWHEDTFVEVCLRLGELTQYDPGKRWGNTPLNSLIQILLPWFPQTLASSEKRANAVATLCKKQPDVGYELLLKLISNPEVSRDTHRPFWRDTVPQLWAPSVTNEDVAWQLDKYSQMAVEMATQSPQKLVEITKQIGYLGKASTGSFERLLEFLEAKQLPDNVKASIWEELKKVAHRHRSCSDANWALGFDQLQQIEDTATVLNVTEPMFVHKRLFTTRAYWDFYEQVEDWEKEFQDTRRDAVHEILANDKVDGVFSFAESVEDPWQVGYALGQIDERLQEVDAKFMPEYLQATSPKLSDFVSGFISGRHRLQGDAWVAGLASSAESWSAEQKGFLLRALPFAKQTWAHVDEWLGREQGEYWSTVETLRSIDAPNLGIAVGKLIEHGRPYAAVARLNWMVGSKVKINPAQCVSALLAIPASKEDVYGKDVREVADLIKLLRKHNVVDGGELFKIEMANLHLLDRDDFKPETLEARLQKDPEFFFKMIKIAGRPDTESESVEKLNESERAQALQVSSLLYGWQKVPGMKADESLDGKSFSDWMRRMKTLCQGAGYWQAASVFLARVLVHAPSDPSGLWVHAAVADELEQENAETMRRDYIMALFNSRGVHVLEPSGDDEQRLAEKYQKMSQEATDKGFVNLGTALKDLFREYMRQAERLRADEWP